LMQSVTLRLKDPHYKGITSQILLGIHRKAFMKVDSSLVFIKVKETKEEKVLDLVDALACQS
jgi:hypothetical protein